MTGPLSLMTQIENELAALAARVCDCRVVVAKAVTARTLNDTETVETRMASASRIMRECEAMAANVRKAMTAYGVNETLREACTGGPARLSNVRPVAMPRVVIDNGKTRQPDDPGPCAS